MKKDVLIEVENTQTLGGRDEKYTVSVNGFFFFFDWGNWVIYMF